jgi:hypothetical protein
MVNIISFDNIVLAAHEFLPTDFEKDVIADSTQRKQNIITY